MSQPPAADQRGSLIDFSVGAVARMARRLIGSEVQLRLDLAESVLKVLADPAQVEQLLLNLIVNARDAMPSGGMIAVHTANLRLHTQSPEILQAASSGRPAARLP